MLRILRGAYVAFIAAASGVAVDAAAHGSGETGHGAHVMLAIPELLAALAFLVEPVEIAACGVLLLVYAAASVLSLQAGDLLALLRFVYFAVTAVYIVHEHRSIQARLQQPATAA